MSEATCPNCGATIDEEVDDRCPECNTPLKVVCPNCGNRVPENDDVCPDCGGSLAHAAEGG